MKIPIRAILRSLLFDLLVPWLISAVFVALFVVTMGVFGLFALLPIWPVAFLLFLLIAKQRQLLRDAELDRPPADALPDDESLGAEELMQRFGIRHSGRYYSVAGMDFDRLADAVAHGRMRAGNQA